MHINAANQTDANVFHIWWLSTGRTRPNFLPKYWEPSIHFKTSFIILGPNDLTSAGVTVTCKSRYMDVALNRLVYPWLVPGSLHMSLMQSNCTAYNVTDMQIRIQAPLYGCGTNTLRKNKFVLESRNVFVTREKQTPGFRIKYLPDMHFPFICRYEIIRSAGKIVLKSLGK